MKILVIVPRSTRARLHRINENLSSLTVLSGNINDIKVYKVEEGLEIEVKEEKPEGGE